MEIESIRNYDENGERHGYQQGEWYHAGLFTISYRGMVRHGIKIGYTEWHVFGECEYYIS